MNISFRQDQFFVRINVRRCFSLG